MELDILKQNTTWNDASASINNNFAKVKTALEQGGGGTVEGAAKYYPIYDPEWQYGFELSEEQLEANKAAYKAAFAREEAVYYFDMEIKDATVAVTDVLLIGEAVLFRCALVSEKFADDNIISRTERLVTLGSDGVPDVSVQDIDFATKQYVDNEVEDAKAYSEEMADNAEKAAKQYTDEKIKNSGGGGGEKEAYRVYEYASSAEEIEANTLAFHAALSQKDCVFYLQESFETRIEASRILATGSYVELHFVKIETYTVGYTAILLGERVVQLGDAGDGVVTTETFYYPTVKVLDEARIDALLSTKQDTLVSGTNIKTIGGESILGEGDIPLPEGGSSIEVDNKLSSTSENPVQNKVIYAELIERFEGIDELLDAINGEEI